MRVAVAYDALSGDIGAHFGHAEYFAIYDSDAENTCAQSKRLISTEGRSGHSAMAELMRSEGVDAVLSGNIGTAAKAALLSLGIVPVMGYEGPADMAADMLIAGLLPLDGSDPDSAWSYGGCGGCSGCASHGDGGCNCGGNCGCGM